MPKVYIPNRGSGHDYTEATKYGRLTFVSEGMLSPFNTGRMKRAWTEALKDSEPNDWILVTSLNSLCMVGAALFAKRHSRLNLLLFSNTGKYIKREIVL